MSQLADWMARNNVSDAALAERLTVSRAQVSRLRRGKHRPSVSTAKELEAITEIPWPELIEDALQ